MLAFLGGFLLGAWIGFALAAMMAVSSRESRREEERHGRFD